MKISTFVMAAILAAATLAFPIGNEDSNEVALRQGRMFGIIPMVIATTALSFAVAEAVSPNPPISSRRSDITKEKLEELRKMLVKAEAALDAESSNSTVAA